MKRISRLNKIIALALACALFLSSPIGVFADNDAPTQESQQELSSEEGSAAENESDVDAVADESDDAWEEESNVGDFETNQDASAEDTADTAETEEASKDEDAQQQDDESENEEEPEEESEEESENEKHEHSFVYTSNEDGKTHTVECENNDDKDCDFVTTDEDCDFGYNGTCVKCGQDKLKVDTDSILYKNTAYGTAYTTEKHVEGSLSKEEASKYKDGYALQIYHSNDGYSERTKLIAPSETSKSEASKYIVYSSDEDGKFTFTIEAPENYYIDSLKVGSYNNGKFKASDEAKIDNSNTKTTSFSWTFQLTPIGDEGHVNILLVSLKTIPVTLTEETTEVAGATLINYKNNTDVFGDTFKFNNGADSGSNKCYYTQVYQGLAANRLSNDKFKLASDNGVALFPDYSDYESYLASKESNEESNEESKKYDYITAYYPNANVTFNKDNDGYWTLDSSSYEYVYDTTTNTLTTSSGTQFRPFGTDTENKDHFGMELPITFSINSDGQTNGKDTVFKFAGDDDVFVYIDGRLVLDLGGIHDVIKGQINFRTGEILIQGEYQNALTSSVDETVYKNKGLKNKNLYEILNTKLSSFANKEHKLTVVYFERGGNLSNCKISYNFNKEESVDVKYEGLKLDENKDKLAGAEFTLYEDETCNTIATNGSGQLRKAVSDENGTISFDGLSAGIIKNGTGETSKTYYMKETKAAEYYKTPTDAIWKLTLVASADGTKKSTKSTLTAVNEAAKAISLFETDKAGNQTVKAITNERKTGSLRIIKDLKTFVKSQGTATFVFEVRYELNGKAHSNVYSYDFNEAGRQNSILIDNLPAGVDVTVTEVYSGACYKPVGDVFYQTVTIVADGDKVADDTEAADNTTVTKNTVTFVNDYDGRTNYGGISIKNVFTKLAEVVDGISYKFEKAIMGGKQ